MSGPTNGSPANAPQPRVRSGRVVVPHKAKWYQRGAAWCIWALVRSVAASLRIDYDDRSGLPDGSLKGPAICCVWHNRLALSLVAYNDHVRVLKRTRGMAALVSASKDGAFLAAVLERFGVQPVRGSSSRRGPQALLELTTWAERGYDLAITPDGPRGPRYVAQEGVISLAQITGLPILPASYTLKGKIVVKSWDGFQVPLPLGKCVVVIEKPMHIPRRATDAEREKLRQQLQRTLLQIARD